MRASADYHPGYYAAFVLDLDGNNVEAVYHGEVDRLGSVGGLQVVMFDHVG